LGYRVTFAAGAKRQLEKLPKSAQQRLGQMIGKLSDDPRPRGVVKLSGEEGLYRVRSGDYRAIYRLEDDLLVVLVVKVGHRREIDR